MLKVLNWMAVFLFVPAIALLVWEVVRTRREGNPLSPAIKGTILLFIVILCLLAAQNLKDTSDVVAIALTGVAVVLLVVLYWRRWLWPKRGSTDQR
jgi:O-antigen/teichoic acid export membrane protein